MKEFNLLRFFDKFCSCKMLLPWALKKRCLHSKKLFVWVVDCQCYHGFTPSDGSVLLGCSCHPSGVSPTECPPSGEACLCDPDTGKCPCLPSVTGRTCDHCADGYWNLVPGRGCQPCDCDPRTSLSSRCDQARNFQLPMVSQ